MSRMPTRRYIARKAVRGGWSVYDGFTGLPAASDGKDLVGLSEVNAKELADILNEADAAGKPPLL